MNDFNKQTVFSAHEFEAAGFTRLRWDVSRILSQTEKDLIKEAKESGSDNPEMGNLKLYVLTKGLLRFDNSEFQESREE